MRIVFMGTPEFAVPSLQILSDHHYEIAAVVTAPEKPRGRGQKPAPSAVKQAAVQRDLRVLQPENLKDPSFTSEIKSLRPDLLAVVAFRILPPSVFSLASRGSFNLHASLLPKYRGAAPINWALINGEQETGVTTFFLQESVDTGSIILQARVKIGADETAGELHDRLAAVGAEIVLQTVRLIELGKANPRKQDEAGATPAPKIYREDCRVDWGKPTIAVHNFVRGLSPAPGAWDILRGKVIRFYRTRLSESGGHANVKPGTIVRADKESLRVKTGDGAIELSEIQLEGRRRMGVQEFLRGFAMKEGEGFEGEGT